MSKLQTLAKPHLRMIVLDECWPVISERVQQVLSSWIAMFSMVSEFDHPQTVMIPDHQRRSFGNNQNLPNGWRIAEGRYDLRHNPAVKDHIACRMINAPPWGFLRLHDMQTTGFTVGSLLVLVFSSFQVYPNANEPHPDYNEFCSEFLWKNGLHQIWPFVGDISAAPPVTHDKNSADRIFQAFARQIGMNVLRF